MFWKMCNADCYLSDLKGKIEYTLNNKTNEHKKTHNKTQQVLKGDLPGGGVQRGAASRLRRTVEVAPVPEG
ncbi:hypothetical protein MEO93_26520 [Dolichospermum sp. ST_sed3]|nr:hypothetical protein [Dolichospermum sp. ST_sed3]